MRPGLTGFRRILALISPAPLIVVSSMSENQIVTSALKLGASGFLPKHSPRSTFKAALETIQDGRAYVPDNFIATELSTEQSRAVEAVATQTPQQARILELISDGLLNKQIAHELSIAEATVKAHVTAIMRKLGVNNRTQAVLVAGEAKFKSILPSSGEWQWPPIWEEIVEWSIRVDRSPKAALNLWMAGVFFPLDFKSMQRICCRT